MKTPSCTPVAASSAEQLPELAPANPLPETNLEWEHSPASSEKTAVEVDLARCADLAELLAEQAETAATCETNSENLTATLPAAPTGFSHRLKNLFKKPTKPRPENAEASKAANSAEARKLTLLGKLRQGGGWYSAGRQFFWGTQLLWLTGCAMSDDPRDLEKPTKPEKPLEQKIPAPLPETKQLRELNIKNYNEQVVAAISEAVKMTVAEFTKQDFPVTAHTFGPHNLSYKYFEEQIRNAHLDKGDQFLEAVEEDLKYKRLFYLATEKPSLASAQEFIDYVEQKCAQQKISFQKDIAPEIFPSWVREKMNNKDFATLAEGQKIIERWFPDESARIATSLLQEKWPQRPPQIILKKTVRTKTKKPSAEIAVAKKTVPAPLPAKKSPPSPELKQALATSAVDFTFGELLSREVAKIAETRPTYKQEISTAARRNVLDRKLDCSSFASHILEAMGIDGVAGLDTNSLWRRLEKRNALQKTTINKARPGSLIFLGYPERESYYRDGKGTTSHVALVKSCLHDEHGRPEVKVVEMTTGGLLERNSHEMIKKMRRGTSVMGIFDFTDEARAEAFANVKGEHPDLVAEILQQQKSITTAQREKSSKKFEPRPQS